MKKIWNYIFVAIICLFAANMANAQIRIGVKLAHKTVIQHEQVMAFITIYNDTKETLVIHKDYGDFRLIPFMQDEKREPLSVINTNSICSELRVRVGQKEQISVDISKWYNLLKVQNYALVIYGEWKGAKYKSNQVALNVVNGFVLKSVDKAFAGKPDDILHYELRYWSREGSEHLFLRVDEPSESLNYGVFDLGKVIRFFDPILKIDADGNIKIVHQVGPDCYKKSIFKIEKDGITFIDQSYHLANGAPYPHLKH